MPWDLINQFDYKPSLFQVMAWCRHARSHYPNLYWPKSQMLYIARLGHNEFSRKDDFRIQAFLIESDGWLPISWSSVLGLPSQLSKLIFSLSHIGNQISYLILYIYRLTCPGTNFTGKALKPKFSRGMTGRPLILHKPCMLHYVFLVLSYWYWINHDAM